MSLRHVAAAALAVLAALGAAPAGAAEARHPPRPVAAADADDAPRVIVRFRTDSAAVKAMAARRGAELRQAQALAARHGVALSDGRMLDARTQLVFGSGPGGGRALAQRLAADPQVEYAEVDRRVRVRAVPNDPLYPAGLAGITPAVGQWYLRPPDATFVSAINAEQAWDVSTGSAGVVVAVLDTGTRLDHPDLAGKLVGGYDFVSSAAIGNDGDGRDADPSDPGDWVSQSDVNGGALGSGCTSADISDSSWHGTQTAGLVGAVTDNALGMASVGRGVKVLPVRVLGKCGGFVSDVVDAMKWAAGIAVAGVPANAYPARVVNLSLGAGGSCGATFQDTVNQLKARNVAVVVAAGNGDGFAVDAPGNCSGAITVAGLRHAGTKVGYSNVGPEVTLGAPAGNCVNTTGTCLYPIISTANSGTQGPVSPTYTSGGSDAGLGTSFSAPLVSGAVALMASANPALSVDALRLILQRTARAYPASGGSANTPACRAPATTEQLECYCTTSTCGAGMLDAGEALRAIGQQRVLVDIAAPAAQPAAGQALVVSATSVAAGNGRSIATRQWTVVPGTATATLTGGADTDTVTVVPQGTGSFTLTLTASDDAGHVGTQSLTLGSSGGTGDGGGGGGALGLEALALMALAAAAARRRARR